MIECVPNFSEGRDKSIIDQIVLAIESVPGVKVLHIDMGYDAHRTVITFVGDMLPVQEAAYRSILRAFQLIDMSVHHGAHPRIGAVDVFPFVPLEGSTMQEAIDCSKVVGERIGNEFKVPVYLYNQSASQSERRLLAEVRKGEYEGLEQKLSTSEGKPDFGSDLFNAKTGALIIGARKLLLAYNFNLNTKDVKIAKAIAKRLREKDGGLKSVRAIGWYMEEYQCAQVSTNLTDLDETPLHIAFDTCKAIAKEFNVELTGSELVGLIPKKSLIDTVHYFNKNEELNENECIKSAIQILGLNSIKPFDENKQVIENLILL